MYMQFVMVYGINMVLSQSLVFKVITEEPSIFIRVLSSMNC